ncbi:MAG TPA: penicillin-binding transpeptidase domain-containing protein, partial [Gammaproteobacteria bacterium]|nr:penicillin-binding transpeptidase domain-containing protein [Gammaproteobacteria bacterium]
EDTHNNLWRPQNDNERFSGPTSLRMGLVRSRNLVSIRLLDAVGIDKTIEYLSRFGFDTKTMPHGLSLALGTLEATPLEMTSSLSIFANGGYRVTPYLIDQVADAHDVILIRSRVAMACPAPCDPVYLTEHNATAAPQVISTANAYIITDILKDVIKRGTGRGALVLERSDLSGKTGSTNDHKDAWFVGYNGNIVATVWIGYDRTRLLNEYASKAALPIWIDFMREALRDMPEYSLPQPADIVHVRIDERTGALASSGDPYAIFELFTKQTAPHATSGVVDAYAPDENWAAPESLF